MRQLLLSEGAKELSYEIREIVKKAELLKKLGLDISWENIGDPIQKNHVLPDWIKNIISDLVRQNDVYSYCPSKGMSATREFLAQQTNELGGVQIEPDDICFFNGLGDAISKVYQYINSTSRVIGPSPAYSTHSSAEAAHANHEPITYKLDPNRTSA
jgi:aspartate/methionine/tyrosine aminotransferase